MVAMELERHRGMQTDQPPVSRPPRKREGEQRVATANMTVINAGMRSIE
jgi:hypothetical protein